MSLDGKQKRRLDFSKIYAQILEEEHEENVIRDFENKLNKAKIDYKKIIEHFVVPEMMPYVIISGGHFHKHIWKNVRYLDEKNDHDIDIFIWKLPPKDIRRQQYRLIKGMKSMSAFYPSVKGKISKKAFSVIDPTFHIDLKVQFIPKISKTPKDVINSFDITNTMLYYEPNLNQFVYHEKIPFLLNDASLSFSPLGEKNIKKYLKYDIKTDRYFPKRKDNRECEYYTKRYNKWLDRYKRKAKYK